MAGPNLKITVGLENLVRRDYPVATPALLNPNNANPLVDGEWLVFDGNKNLVRGSSEGTGLPFPLHTEKGRYDTQAIGMGNIIFGGFFEAWTKVVHISGLAVGDYLTVQDVTYQSLTRRGLKKKSGSSGGIVVVGVVSKIDTTNAKVEFIHFGKQIVF